jgi:hypothetical protein
MLGILLTFFSEMDRIETKKILCSSVSTCHFYNLLMYSLHFSWNQKNVQAIFDVSN